MPFPLSSQSIDAIAMVISGGAANSDKPSIGIYRSATSIEMFMKACGVPFSVNGSRLPSLKECLIEISESPKAEEKLPRIIKNAANPCNFNNDTKLHNDVVKYLNDRLKIDKFMLVQMEYGGMKLVEVGQEAFPLVDLGKQLESIDFDSAKRDLDRALANIRADPEDAITAACSMLESVCRSILTELGKSLPTKKDINSLYNALREPLGLSANRDDVKPQIAKDVQKLLSGLCSVTQGIGSLRTHGGDAHGREGGSVPFVDERIARLSIHAASTLALFLIETWERNKPESSVSKS